MARISKKPDAPEGPVKLSIGMTHLHVKDGEGVDTDDLAVIEAVRNSYSQWLEVEEEETGDATAAGKEESKAINELLKEQDKAKKQHAEKDPLEPAAPVPTSLADLEETVEAREEIEEGSKGGRK